MRRILLGFILAGFCIPPAFADDIKSVATPVRGADNYLKVPYLPDRFTGKFKEDKWATMDVHAPKDDTTHPCVIFVHGGGYGEGAAIPLFMQQKAVERGYVSVNLQYVTKRQDVKDPIDGKIKQIFPQVFYDFQAAVRYLRKNADRFRIDPNRIAAVGFSAGSWLISSANYGDGGDLVVEHVGNLVKGLPAAAGIEERKAALELLRKNHRFAVPMADRHPDWPEYHSRLNAVVLDYFHFENFITPDDPATATYMGAGCVSPLKAHCQIAGIDFFAGELLEAKYKGQKVTHVPSPYAKVLSQDGKSEIELYDRTLEHLDRVLTQNPRALAPEFRSVGRAFAEELKVELIVPSADTRVHFTTDGSEPTDKSVVYRQALTLTATTTIKAISTRKGAKPSGVTTAVFTKGDAPPEIVGPEKLPAAKVGQLYSVTFAAKGSKPVLWIAAGHFKSVDDVDGKSKSVYGLSIDPMTGTLSGTPKLAGSFVVQIQAAYAYGELADTRSCLIIVE